MADVGFFGKAKYGRFRLEDVIWARKMDYHDMQVFVGDVFERVYTVEKFVYAIDLESSLSEIFRIPRPGAKMALYEFDHSSLSSASTEWETSMKQITKYASMLANSIFDKGVLKTMVANVGIVDIVTDLTNNVMRIL